MKKSILLLMLLAVLVACDSTPKNPLFTPGHISNTDDGKSALISTVQIQTHVEFLQPGEVVSISFPLPKKNIEIKLQPVSPESLALPEGQFAWIGEAKGGNDVFVMRIKESIEAHLQLDGFIYRLRSKDAKTGVLEIFDAKRFREAPNDGVVDPNVTDKGDGASGDSVCQDPATRVDVMVVYTPASRDAAGGDALIQNDVAFAIGRANLAYANSGVTHRLNLVYTGAVSYTEPGGGVNSSNLLGDLAGTDDGVLDSIHGLRDAVQADLVSLMYETDDPAWCGWGQFQETANTDTTDHRAFTVVKRTCAGGYLSLAHEVGHNMGARHDRANTDTGAYNYNFGHIQPTPSDDAVTPWRTVMSYPKPCGDTAGVSCNRVPWFSNPGVSISADATGVALAEAEPEFNVNILALNDAAVSRYRCLRHEVAANVWMKDRWEDEGGEPDPATVGKAMWKSPYIWVRLTEDAALEHEHEHENPRQDQTNFVYVKLHNTGSTSESSNLELYFASASTNLNNPANWTLIDSQARTISAGVDVVKFDWSGLPGSGHYCLLARWNIDGGPLAFTNVGDAVRSDNDLIWRNVNVIGLDEAPDSSADFNMAGDRESNETYLLITTNPVSTRKINWAELAAITVNIDPAVLRGKKQHIVGLKPTGKDMAKGEFNLPLDKTAKLLGPFVLKAGEKTRVKLAIKSQLDAVKKLSSQLANPLYYDVTVMQIRAEGVQLALENSTALFEKKGLVLGGVSYTLRVPANP
jgi:metallopeptidase family M12-like protein